MDLEMTFKRMITDGIFPIIYDIFLTQIAGNWWQSLKDVVLTNTCNLVFLSNQNKKKKNVYPVTRITPYKLGFSRAFIAWTC